MNPGRSDLHAINSWAPDVALASAEGLITGQQSCPNLPEDGSKHDDLLLRTGCDQGRGGEFISWVAVVDPAARLNGFTGWSVNTQHFSTICCSEVQPISTLHLQHLVPQSFLVWIREVKVFREKHLIFGTSLQHTSL